MGIDNTVTVQVHAKDPKKPSEKPEADGKPKPDGKEKDGEDLVRMRRGAELRGYEYSREIVTRGPGAQERT